MYRRWKRQPEGSGYETYSEWGYVVESDEMIHAQGSDITLCLDESYSGGASHESTMSSR